MILKLPKWILTDKFPAFSDTESLTVLEQTARLYGKVNELIESYNGFAENINKTLEEWAKSDHEEEEAFRVGLRQEFQDFIDVTDLKVRDIKSSIDSDLQELNSEYAKFVSNVSNKVAELELYMRDNISDSVKSVVNTMRESGELNDDILAVFTDIHSEVEGIRAENNTFRSDMESAQETFKEEVNASNTEFKTAINTTVTTTKDYLSDKINNHYNNEFTPLSETVEAHTEQLESHDSSIIQYGSDITNLKVGGESLFDESLSIPHTGKYGAYSQPLHDVQNYTLFKIDLYGLDDGVRTNCLGSVLAVKRFSASGTNVVLSGMVPCKSPKYNESDFSKAVQFLTVEINLSPNEDGTWNVAQAYMGRYDLEEVTISDTNTLVPIVGEIVIGAIYGLI